MAGWMDRQIDRYPDIHIFACVYWWIEIWHKIDLGRRGLKPGWSTQSPLVAALMVLAVYHQKVPQESETLVSFWTCPWKWWLRVGESSRNGQKVQVGGLWLSMIGITWQSQKLSSIEPRCWLQPPTLRPTEEGQPIGGAVQAEDHADQETRLRRLRVKAEMWHQMASLISKSARFLIPSGYLT